MLPPPVDQWSSVRESAEICVTLKYICVHVRPCVRDKQNEDQSIELLSFVTREPPQGTFEKLNMLIFICLQVDLVLRNVQTHTHTHTHTRTRTHTHTHTHTHTQTYFSLSSSSLCPPHLDFLFFSRGGLALLWPCSCILGFLTGSQGANKTLLYLGGRAAFRLSCRRSDETQRSHTITGCYSMNEQCPLEMAPSQPGGSQRVFFLLFSFFTDGWISKLTGSSVMCGITKSWSWDFILNSGLFMCEAEVPC